MRHCLRITALLLAVGVVVLAAGCGGSSNSSAPPTTTTTYVTLTTTGSTGGFASAKNCLAFAGLAAQIAKTMNPAAASSPQGAANELQALADAAPSDIKPDLQTVATAFAGYLQAVQNSGYKFGSTTQPTPLQLAALENAAQSFSTSGFTQAEQHLSTWEAHNCHS